MQKPIKGILIASGRPQIRDFFEELVRKEGALTIGQARDVTAALALARQLRPDAAVIDPLLPHVIGMDSIRLSRTGGLDAAQVISEELGETQAIVVSNLIEGAVIQQYLDNPANCSFIQDSTGGKIQLKLQDLNLEIRPQKGPIFADLELSAEPAEAENISTKLTNPEKIMLIGGLSIFAGWFLTLTMVGIPVGVPLAVAGILLLLSGLALRRLTSRRARK